MLSGSHKNLRLSWVTMVKKYVPPAIFNRRYCMVFSYWFVGFGLFLLDVLSIITFGIGFGYKVCSHHL